MQIWELPSQFEFVNLHIIINFTDDVARSVILLINTIYFNGYWSNPFAENETVVQNFFVNTRAPLSVPFMTKTDYFYYSESSELDAKVLRLPYKVIILCIFFRLFAVIHRKLCYSLFYQGYKFAMYIVLPNRRDGLDELVSRIDSSTLHRTQILMEKVEVKASLPKFKFTNTVKLNEILKAVTIRITLFCSSLKYTLDYFCSLEYVKCSHFKHHFHN